MNLFLSVRFRIQKVGDQGAAPRDHIEMERRPACMHRAAGVFGRNAARFCTEWQRPWQGWMQVPALGGGLDVRRQAGSSAEETGHDRAWPLFLALSWEEICVEVLYEHSCSRRYNTSAMLWVHAGKRPADLAIKTRSNLSNGDRGVIRAVYGV